eukprot:CAMPEP_0185736194 /NCGR_PEP_ID=MMETSP1171-20130828/27194_1 /TAXON_ID=374046 /ORGANISM="Helicotheca tamensis, Strain CCMP826" /LENGTH=843 /DNA_ID=CAMNT_0028406727 /DNA_START=64 /DNA_END=2595 /DNA_ORIENTATION=+
MSKSQKKRMKRKAATARKEAMEREQRETGGLPQLGQGTATSKSNGGTGANLNPHVKLRSDLVSHGYSIDEVERAIDDMWNLQLPYDEFDSVLAYLEARKVQQEVDERADSEPDSSELAPTAVGKSSREDEDVSIPPSASVEKRTPEAAVDETIPDDDDGNLVPTEEKSHAVDTHESENGSAPAANLAKPNKVQPPPPMDFASKLELLSNVDNITDAVTALSEWVSKAAKRHEIAALCDFEKTNALPTIVRRAILECTDELAFDSFVLPGILNTIGSVLRSLNGSLPSSTSSVIDALGTAIRQSRCAISSSNAVEGLALADTIATATSSFIMSSIRQYVEYSQDSGPTTGVEKVRQLEEEIDALASSIVPNSSKNGVVELMSKRDSHKLAAEKSSTVVDIAMLSLKAAKPVGENSVNGSDSLSGLKRNLVSEEEKNALLTSLLGDEYDAIIASREGYNALKVDLEDARSATSGKRNILMEERNSYQAECDRVAARMDELRREMEALEEENAILTGKIEGIDSKITALDDSCGDEVKEIKLKLTERGKSLKVEDDSRAVIDSLGSFESSLYQLSTSSVNRTVVKNDLADKVPNKMGIYLVRMRNYFKAEADIIEYIYERKSSLENGMNDLEREIEEFTGLGMTANVNQMTQQYSVNKQNIEEDNSAIAALRGEAKQMLENLMLRLEQYDNESGEAFTALQMSMLNGISSAITRIGLDSDGGLGTYLASLGTKNTTKKKKAGANGSKSKNGANGSSETTPDLDANENIKPATAGSAVKSDNAAPVAPTITASKSKPLNPHPLPQDTVSKPKFSWGVKATSAKKPMKSFLDIQQEELSAKAATNDEN